MTIMKALLSFAVAGPAAALAAATGDVDPAVDSGWWAAARQRVAASEYEISWQERTLLPDLDRAWQAPNRAHNLRTYFTENGIRVVRRTEATPSWELSLSLTGFGRGSARSPVREARLLPDGNRIDYDRGEIVEWYVNEPRGLKQGFTLLAPPLEGEGHAFLALALGGTLSPAIRADGRAIDFRAPGGTKVLHYAALHVFDARGHELSSWMEGFTDGGVRGIRIVFDDREAAYPVTVDPLATNPAWTAEGDEPYALFGYAVSSAGDVNGDGYSDVIVGAYLFDHLGFTDAGQVRVYHGSSAGLSPVADWTAGVQHLGAYFGVSVATAGDVNGDGYADVIVGAVRYDNGEADEGRAYVYHGSPAGLSPGPAWSAESDQAGAEFGRAVATAGDVNGDGYGDVIVGANLYDGGLTDEGRAFVYHGSPGGLSLAADWSADADQAGAELGVSVSTAGDVNGDGYADAIVGAHLYDDAETDEGRAFVYHGSPAGLSPTPDQTVGPDQAFARFGYSVSAAGDVNGDGYADAFVGAYLFDNGETNEGRAFVYHGSAEGLALTPDWSAEPDQIGAHLGISVSTAGDVNGDGYADAIVGAYLFDSGETNEGRAFVYHGSAEGLVLTPGWSAEPDQVGARFGISVATAGDVNGDGYADVIVGAREYDNGQADEGRAFVYLGSPAGLAQSEAWIAEADQDGAELGISVAAAGDVNGDGYGDVIVGAHRFDNGQTDEGRAFVYHGSPAGLAQSEAWIAEADQAFAQFGHSVSAVGDVNGDGYADVIVGAHRFSNGQTDEGRAFVYHGSPAGLAPDADWSAEADQVAAEFGCSVSAAGDVNGDGYADVIIGACLYESGQPDEGRVYVYHGSSAGLGPAAAWIAEADQPSAEFGYSVSSAGDVNGDGFSDVIVGAPRFDNGELDEGRAFVYHGSSAGLSAFPNWNAEGNQDSRPEFGISVATAGDVNGDGYSDVIVGAHRFSNGQTNEGRAFVYHGSAVGLESGQAWTAESNQVDARFGYSVATGGDLNGDGYADVIVGAPSYEGGQPGEGRAYVYHGSPTGLSFTWDWTAEANLAFGGFGASVATAGDVNGDGYADVIVGADLYDSGEPDEGRAFVYYGNDGKGLDLRPFQRRADDGAPVGVLGSSVSPHGFRLALTGRTPFGRGKVKLEWEVEPFGTAFDGAGTSTSSDWMDTGTAGVQLNELVSGLAKDTLYHWRVRLLYDPVTIPFQQASRWLTVPWNGWQQADLRTAVAPAGRVPDGDTLPGLPLTVDKAGGGDVALSWGDSCTATDDDYEIYEGTIDAFYDHTAKFCTTGGATTKTFTPGSRSTYYLVVPTNGEREGSYGRDGNGVERSVGGSACAPQEPAGC